jgi:hypothetical protein
VFVPVPLAVPVFLPGATGSASVPPAGKVVTNTASGTQSSRQLRDSKHVLNANPKTVGNWPRHHRRDSQLQIKNPSRRPLILGRAIVPARHHADLSARKNVS